MNCFSQDYVEARAKFIAAALAAGAEVNHFALDKQGPDGSELSTETAWLGPADARAVLVTISGTHGVEGFFGSATQIEWLERSKATRLPAQVAALHIHAINPFGFAWLRRTNEENVDVNRNWIDFDAGLPANRLYDELSDDLCPADWSAETQAITWTRLQAWAQAHGFAQFQSAISSGQWAYPNGLFYGGARISWSRRVLTDILTSKLAHSSRVCILDFHTGLGAFGYAEPIVGLARSDPGFARTRGWIGAGAKSVQGESVSAEINGDSLSVLPALLPQAVVDAVALECGVRPILDVLAALRADAWLNAHADPRAAAAVPIKRQMRDAFHSDDPVWQGMALGQGLAACQAAIGGLGLPAE